MVRHRVLPTITCLALLCALAVRPASAQNWSFDARRIALGSPGGGENLASQMIQDESRYRSIVLPFGLLQVFRDIDRLDPSKDDFDIVRTIEYAASPLHYTFGRPSGASAGSDFVVDIANGELSRDLNSYKGFIPVNQPAAEGLASPNWGKTFKVHKGSNGAFQGFYVGAGPYLSMRTAATFDQRLLDVLASGPNSYVPNSSLTAADTTTGQFAIAITGGYRARFAFANGRSERDGLYVAVNYDYLHGMRYEDVGLQVRLDTDAAGLITLRPSAAPALSIARVYADTGKGMAIDLGLGAVAGNWELGVGASGLGNHIDWTDVSRRTYSLGSLLTGGDLVESLPTPAGSVRVELPVDVKGNLAYNGGRWTAIAEAGRGYQGHSFHGGGEVRLGAIDLRGGGTYVRQLWNPSAGLGLNMGRRLSLDLAVYSNTSNVERARKPALAASLRVNH